MLSPSSAQPFPSEFPEHRCTGSADVIEAPGYLPGTRLGTGDSRVSRTDITLALNEKKKSVLVKEMNYLLSTCNMPSIEMQVLWESSEEERERRKEREETRNF